MDGIGVQGHFGNTARSKDHLTNCFNILDDVGVPIKITELDIGSISSSEAAKANQLENVFRAAFEHQCSRRCYFLGLLVRLPLERLSSTLAIRRLRQK